MTVVKMHWVFFFKAVIQADMRKHWLINTGITFCVFMCSTDSSVIGCSAQFKNTLHCAFTEINVLISFLFFYLL